MHNALALGDIYHDHETRLLLSYVLQLISKPLRLHLYYY